MAGDLTPEASPERAPEKAPELPPVGFDPRLEISPYTLYRRLAAGRPPRLYALATGGGPTLAGALPYLGPRELLAPDTGPATAAEPDADPVTAVLFDRGGEAALAEVRRLRASGLPAAFAVRALYGGLALYELCLDPQVVGGELFLTSPGPG